MVVGLELNNFCVHTPIPVEIQESWETPHTMELRILDPDTLEDLIKPPKLYGDANTETYYIDLAPWVRLCMAKLQNTNRYLTSPQSVPDDYTRRLTIEFRTANQNFERVGKDFVHCALAEGYRLYEQPFDNLKVWKCYPFSWLEDGERQIIIPNTDTAPTIPRAFVEYDTGCCDGTFVKWLNEYGSYNYWLFPTNHRGLEREAEEIYRMPRNIFDPDKTSNVDTAGFVPTEILTVRDIVLKRYWPLMKSLVASPEVYILKNDWTIGTNVAPEDWVQVIQSDASFERSEFGRSATELEIDFEVPKIYTQTRL